MSELIAEYNKIHELSRRVRELEGELEYCRNAYERRIAELNALKEMHAEELAAQARVTERYRQIVKQAARAADKRKNKTKGQ